MLCLIYTHSSSGLCFYIKQSTLAYAITYTYIHTYRIVGKFGELTVFKHLAKESLVN